MNGVTEYSVPIEETMYGNQVSAFGAGRQPEWVKATTVRFSELLDLPNNWDHQNASPIDRATATFAFDLLSKCLRSNTPAPQVFPLPSGGVQMEWHMKNIDLEIEVEAPFEVYFSFEDHLLAGRGCEKELNDDFSTLDGPLTLLSNR